MPFPELWTHVKDCKKFFEVHSPSPPPSLRLNDFLITLTAVLNKTDDSMGRGETYFLLANSSEDDPPKTHN